MVRFLLAKKRTGEIWGILTGGAMGTSCLFAPCPGLCDHLCCRGNTLREFSCTAIGYLRGANRWAGLHRGQYAGIHTIEANPVGHSFPRRGSGPLCGILALAALR